MLNRIIFIIIVTALALIPTWFFLLLRSIANPTGFWQNIVTFGVGIWLLGGLQLIFLVVGVFVLFAGLSKN
ncbi:MAG: hypothetical protein WCV85_01895 [Patescibacteria group bacterium]|jgi:hypothetical protein